MWSDPSDPAHGMRGLKTKATCRVRRCSAWLGIGYLQSQMMTIQLQTLSKVEAMCGMTSIAGIQVNSPTLVRPRVVNQPIEQRACKTSRSVSGQG